MKKKENSEHTAFYIPERMTLTLSPRDLLKPKNVRSYVPNNVLGIMFLTEQQMTGA